MHTLLVLDLAAKSLAILLAAFAIQSLWHGASAAQRCMVWLAAFGCLLALPLTLAIEPRWTLVQEILEEGPAEMATPMEANTAVLPEAKSSGIASIAKAAPIPWLARFTLSHWVASAWLTGVLLVLSHRLLGSWQLRQLRMHSHPCRNERLLQKTSDLAASLGIRRRVVEVRASETITVPATWGVFKPVLLLPAVAQEWDDEALSAALLHELGHIRHWDAATRLLSTLVGALHWPNPLVWRAASAWRMAQEQAADDLVLVTGASAQNYARQLLEAARAFRQGGLLKAPALAMARPATLEKRLTTILDASRNRRRVGKSLRVLVTVTSALVMATLLSLRVQGEPVKGQKPTGRTEEAAPDNKLIALEIKFLEAPPGRLTKEFHDLDSKTVSANDLNKLLRPLFTDPAVKVASYPRMITCNRCEVMFRSGQSFPRPEGRAPIYIGQELKLLPAFRGSSIDLEANLWVSKKVGEDKGLPLVSAHTVKTSVKVPDQHTVIVVMEDGATGSIPGDLICLITPTSIAAQTSPQKAATIVLPRVKFSGATLDEVIEFLRVKSAEWDTEQGSVRLVKGKGVNIVVVPDAAAHARLNLDLHKVSVGEALQHVAKLCGMELSYAANAAVLSPTGVSIASLGFQSGSENAPVVVKARSLMIPQYDMHICDFADVIGLVRRESGLLSADGKEIEIVLDTNNAAAHKPITFKLQNISLLDMLHHMAVLADYTLKAEGDALMLTPPKL